MIHRILDYWKVNKSWLIAILLISLADGLSTFIGLRFGLVAERNPIWAGASLSTVDGFISSLVLRSSILLIVFLFMGTSGSKFVREWLFQSSTIGNALIPINNIVWITIAWVKHTPPKNTDPAPFLLILLIGVGCSAFGYGVLWAWRRLRKRDYEEKAIK